MLSDLSYLTKHLRSIAFAAVLLAGLILLVVTATHSQGIPNPDGSGQVQDDAAVPAGPSADQPSAALNESATLAGSAAGLDPTAITLRPGSVRASYPAAAGLVGLTLAALALAGLTAAVLARRDELARH